MGAPPTLLGAQRLWQNLEDLRKQIVLVRRLMLKWDAGKGSITPVANTPTGVTVNFNRQFDNIPIVVSTPQTSVPGSQVLGWGNTNITTSSFDFFVDRTNVTVTNFYWFAVDLGQ